MTQMYFILYKVKQLQVIIYLKSGIPADVLIPAPVWKTVYLDCLIQSARREIFSFKTSGVSKI